MSVKLEKNEIVNISKQYPNTKNISVTLGWDAQGMHKPRGILARINSLFTEPVPDIDCDASAFLCDKDGRIKQNSDIICFDNTQHISGSVNHLGDDTTGVGDGADEEITVDLERFPDTYGKIVFTVNIYKAHERQQNFGMIKNMFLKVSDISAGQELFFYEPDKSCNSKTALIFGELFKDGEEWKFRAVGQGTDDGNITQMSERYR